MDATTYPLSSPWRLVLSLTSVASVGDITQIKYAKQPHGEAMLTSVLFNEDGLHLYIGKDSTGYIQTKNN
jgi:hypothetical protein